MSDKTRWALALVAALGLVVASICTGQDAGSIELPAPDMEGGVSLMQALKLRHSAREFSPQMLPEQTLSDLLWAAFGINRPESGKRTAPSAMNWQEIDIYVAMERGLFLYNAEDHALKSVLAEDLRSATGLQPFVADAPVNLVFVADLTKMTRASEEDKAVLGAADTGFISQNVYLYCASAGLATVVRAWIDHEALHKAMGLRDDQKIILAQTVGFPAEEHGEE